MLASPPKPDTIEGMKATARFLALMLGIPAALIVGMMDAGAVWHTGLNSKIDYDHDRTTAPNGQGDDKFVPGQGMVFGQMKHNVSFSFKFCCTHANPCLPTEQIGAQVSMTVSITTPNGAAAYSYTGSCCTPCCPCTMGTNGIHEGMTSINGVPGAAWGGPATGVSVTATISCVCCDANGQPREITQPPADAVGPTVLNRHPN